MARIKLSGFDSLPQQGGGGGLKNLQVDGADPSRPYKAGSPAAGVFDVTSDFPWCPNPKEARKDVVNMILTEYNPKLSSVLSSLFTIVSQGAEVLPNIESAGDLINAQSLSVSNPIKSTYIAEPTGIQYRFPSLGLGDFSEEITNNFSHGDAGSPFAQIGNSLRNVFETSAGFGSGGGRYLGLLASNATNVAKGLGTIAFQSVSPNDTQFFTSTNLHSYSYTLDLSNGVSTEQTLMNQELVDVLKHQAMFNKNNFLLARSPCLYSCEIRGVKWLPACSLSVTVQSLGNMLLIDGDTVPEAYRLTLSITELIPQIRVVTEAYKARGEKLSAFVSPKEVCQALGDVAQAADGAISRVF